MSGKAARTGVLSVIGFGYGAWLAMWGVIAAGAGHGIYVTMGLSSAPLGLSNNIALTLFGTPFLWCAIGFLLGTVPHRLGMISFLVIMVLHYCSLFFILRPPGTFADWGQMHKVGGTEAVVMGFGMYLIGQFALWVVFIWQLQRKVEQNVRTALESK